MPGKRQHYVPKFLLRRFSTDPANRKAFIYKLDKASGQTKKVNPLNEVVIGRYYRIVHEDGTVDDTADEVLDRIENEAAKVVNSIATAVLPPSPADVLALVSFVVSLKNRTPQAREALREADEQTNLLWLEARLSDQAGYHRHMNKAGRPFDEVEAERLHALDELAKGCITMESTASREIALMFMGFEATTETVFEDLGVVMIRIPTDDPATFVLSDHPVAHYDPTPKALESGASFKSSPNSMTFVALDPKFGLLWTQESPASWDTRWVTGAEVDELNLLTYAWARDSIYGPSQATVTRVRRTAKTNPTMMAAFRYRPPRIWVTDQRSTSSDHRPEIHEFTTRFKDQSSSRRFHVSREAMETAKQNSWAVWGDE